MPNQVRIRGELIRLEGHRVRKLSGHREFLQKVEHGLWKVFDDAEALPAREDSRAFGAMIESRIRSSWKSLCSEAGAKTAPDSGRRAIYDVALEYDGKFFGFDIKTKDLDNERYSDGGVCSVHNLLRFLANSKGIFVVVEFSHRKAPSDRGLRRLEHICVVPFHVLPKETYRIENLGTGQLRLEHGIFSIYDNIEWGRSIFDFFDFFTEKAVEHYEKVGRDAAGRAAGMKRFRENGYIKF